MNIFSRIWTAFLTWFRGEDPDSCNLSDCCDRTPVLPDPEPVAPQPVVELCKMPPVAIHRHAERILRLPPREQSLEYEWLEKTFGSETFHEVRRAMGAITRLRELAWHKEFSAAVRRARQSPSPVATGTHKFVGDTLRVIESTVDVSLAITPDNPYCPALQPGFTMIHPDYGAVEHRNDSAVGSAPGFTGDKLSELGKALYERKAAKVRERYRIPLDQEIPFWMIRGESSHK